MMLDTTVLLTHSPYSYYPPVREQCSFMLKTKVLLFHFPYSKYPPVREQWSWMQKTAVLLFHSTYSHSPPVLLWKFNLDLKASLRTKRPFLTAFSKRNGPTKIEKLGTWQDSIWFRNLWRFFSVLYRGTLGWLLMSLKWHQSWRHHIYQAISMNWPAL